MSLRRPMVALAAVVIAAANVAGCGGDGPSGGGTSLTFMSGGGTYQDAQNEAFIQPFIRDTGIQVHNDTTLSYAKVKTMVEAGNVTIDVIPAEGYWAVQECGKILLPIDTNIVDLSGIDPALIQSECAAPLLTYSTAIYYNTDVFPGGSHPTDCEDFFDTQRFPGKRAASATAVPNALIECALLADGVPRDSLYPLDLDRAFRKLESIKNDLAFWNSGTDSVQLMATGEVAMILAWNGRAYAAMVDQSAPFEAAYAESFMHYDALVVPKGVRDPDAAMKLVAYMMDPARQAKLTSLIPYPPANTNAVLGDLPTELQEFLPPTNPEMAAGTIVQDQIWWGEHAEDVTRRWAQTFQG